MPNPVITEYGESILRKTNGPGAFDPNTGEWSPGAETSEPIFAAVLPLNAAELITEVSSAGLETKNAVAIYSDVELLGSDEATKQPADRIIWNDREYVIKSVSHRYQIASLAHYKSIAFLKDS